MATLFTLLIVGNTWPKNISFATNSECSICYEDMNDAIILKCAHIFHKECINKWTKNTCPLCRTKYSLFNNKFMPKMYALFFIEIYLYILMYFLDTLTLIVCLFTIVIISYIIS